MDSIPALALPLLHELAPLFTQPTWRRGQVLLLAAVLTTGRRTVANLLRTVAALAHGHASSHPPRANSATCGRPFVSLASDITRTCAGRGFALYAGTAAERMKNGCAGVTLARGPAAARGRAALVPRVRGAGRPGFGSVSSPRRGGGSAPRAQRNRPAADTPDRPTP
jgi:hypothetical protein